MAGARAEHHPVFAEPYGFRVTVDADMTHRETLWLSHLTGRWMQLDSS